MESKLDKEILSSGPGILKQKHAGDKYLGAMEKLETMLLGGRKGGNWTHTKSQAMVNFSVKSRRKLVNLSPEGTSFLLGKGLKTSTYLVPTIDKENPESFALCLKRSRVSESVTNQTSGFFAKVPSTRINITGSTDLLYSKHIKNPSVVSSSKNLSENFKTYQNNPVEISAIKALTLSNPNERTAGNSLDAIKTKITASDLEEGGSIYPSIIGDKTKDKILTKEKSRTVVFSFRSVSRKPVN